ncbi:12075_t:CDS:2, partial [Cetraspora pellucida]
MCCLNILNSSCSTAKYSDFLKEYSTKNGYNNKKIFSKSLIIKMFDYLSNHNFPPKPATRLSNFLKEHPPKNSYKDNSQ